MSDKSTKKDDKKIAKDTGKKADKKAAAKKDSSKKSFNPFKSAGKFIREYRSELKKISWPDAKDTTKNALITLGAIFVVGVFIWVLDFGLSELRDLGLKKIPELAASSEKAEDVSSTDTVLDQLIVSDGDSAE